MNHADDDREMTRLLAGARRGWAPTAADAQRVHRGLAAALVAPHPTATAPSRPAAQATWKTWGARIALGGALAGAGTGVGYWAGRRAERRERVAVPAAAAPLPAVSLALPTPMAASSPPTAAPMPKPAIADAHRADRRRRAVPEAATPPTPAESLAAEVRALRNIERALREKNPGLATAFLDDLDREIPRGQMREERAALRAIAGCTSGDRPFGVDPAEDFTQAFPASAYRARVDQACERTDRAAAGDSAARR
jgi:hypothetical protein